MDEWESGENRFDKTGETLFAVLDDGIVAVGGINQEPDARFPSAGRIRRVYVSRSHRGKGDGTLLVTELVAEGLRYFPNITCNVGDLPARVFYERLGFAPVQGYSFTHILRSLHHTSPRRAPASE
jgi:predicted GNAT family acetyltransferase